MDDRISALEARLVEAERVDVGQENRRRHEGLLLAQAEFGGLLDGVGHVAAGGGEGDDLGLGTLRLKEKRTHVGGVQGKANLAQHRAAACRHRLADIVRERMAEGIVDGDEKPAVIACGRHDLRQAEAIGIARVNPLRGGFGAGLAGEIRGSGGDEGDLVQILRQALHGEAHGRVGEVGDDVHAVLGEPLPRLGGADVRLVLVIGEDQLDLLAEDRAAELLDGHPRGLRRAGAGEVGIEARLIVQNADLYRVAAHLRLGGGAVYLQRNRCRDGKPGPPGVCL